MAKTYSISSDATLESETALGVTPSQNGGHIIESVYIGPNGLRVVHKLELSTAEAAQVIAKLARQIAVAAQ